ncbi:MAG: hypothetical protein AAGJ81_06550 [Verrucomicrobiota bacterium]
MRVWPPLQILILLLLIAVGWLALSSIVGNTKQAYDTDLLTSVDKADYAELSPNPVFIEVIATAPFASSHVALGDQNVEVLTMTDSAFSVELERWNDEALILSGSFDPRDLPVAIRIEVEDSSEGTDSTVHWIRRPASTITIRRSDFNE